MLDSFNTRQTLTVRGKTYHFHKLSACANQTTLDKLPFSHKILLENLLRREDNETVSKTDIQSLLNWDAKAVPSQEIAFMPARVLLQDFTGVPAIVDLAAMREAMAALKGSPKNINPLAPVDLVIDHSVMVDYFGSSNSILENTAMEFERNQERYEFLRWGQTAFNNFRVVPPSTGIVHQVNLEYLACVVFQKVEGEHTLLYPDTLVGTDSHTTMINGLGVMGWGVGGIEAEAAMLGQPVTMLIPQVIGVKLEGELPKGATATDLVLVVTQLLRAKGVVDKIVEFYGPGLAKLALADRATIANMAPEYGATCGLFPIDAETLNYLRLSGRDETQIDLVEAYAKAQGLFHTANSPEAIYSDTLNLNLGTVVPSIAGPKRPQDRIPLTQSQSAFWKSLPEANASITAAEATKMIDSSAVPLAMPGNPSLRHGDVVIAAITSCTNTSNPSVMVAAGLIAKKAHSLGLRAKPYVKTSLAPGSAVVTDYLSKAGLLEPLASLGFNLVGYGCTTCIGNSGPLPEPIAKALDSAPIAACAVLSGNRNFEGRIHPQVSHSYLASPPLVVIYAIAGTMNIDLETMPIGTSKDGHPVYMRDLWPSSTEIQAIIAQSITPEMFRQRYNQVFEGDKNWKSIDITTSELYQWKPESTYVKLPPYFENISKTPAPLKPIQGARVLALLGDSVTTDHISPAGSIGVKTPAGQYLIAKGIEPVLFNSYGARRGNHEVMVRGTFANTRLKNQLAPDTQGGWTKHQPSGEVISIYDASIRYANENCSLIVLAGKEYGTGSSRDWAAKGTKLLGIRAVIAESFERIHRSNLIGMGLLPLEFITGQSASSLGLTGLELFDIDTKELSPHAEITVKASLNNQTKEFKVRVRIDTPKELEYYRQGGILSYVLRQLA